MNLNTDVNQGLLSGFSDMSLFVNGMATALLLVLLVQQITQVGFSTQRDQSTILLILGLVSFFVSPFYIFTPFLWFGVPLVVSVPVSFYVFTKSLFDENYRITPWHTLFFILCVGFTSFCFIAYPTPSELWASFFFASRLILILFLLLGFWECLSGWKDDLLSARRVIRIILAFSFGMILLVHFVTDLSAGIIDESLLTITSIGFAMTLGGLCAFLFTQPKESLASLLTQTDITTETVSSPVLAQSAVQTTPELTALNRLMDEEKLYREHGLSLTTLAERIQLKEHQLRKIIHESKGFKNFSEYVGSYRLNEIKQRLADPQENKLPILTIALEAGYKSINPFNRAFKQNFGMTPSEYRQNYQR